MLRWLWKLRRWWLFGPLVARARFVVHGHVAIERCQVLLICRGSGCAKGFSCIRPSRATFGARFRSSAGVQPTRVYNSRRASVNLSFDEPIETLDSIIRGTLNMLGGDSTLGQDIRSYTPSSSECMVGMR
jgi:hypothetical protein